MPQASSLVEEEIIVENPNDDSFEDIEEVKVSRNDPNDLSDEVYSDSEAEERDENSGNNEEDEDMEDYNNYNKKIQLIIHYFKSINRLRITKQPHFSGRLFDNLDQFELDEDEEDP